MRTLLHKANGDISQAIPFKNYRDMERYIREYPHYIKVVKRYGKHSIDIVMHNGNVLEVRSL